MESDAFKELVIRVPEDHVEAITKQLGEFASALGIPLDIVEHNRPTNDKATNPLAYDPKYMRWFTDENSGNGIAVVTPDDIAIYGQEKEIPKQATTRALYSLARNYPRYIVTDGFKFGLSLAGLAKLAHEEYLVGLSGFGQRPKEIIIDFADTIFISRQKNKTQN